MTNLLYNHQDYRRIAELWKDWVNKGKGSVQSREDYFEEIQELCRSMDNFVLLVLVRALDQLGFEEISSDENASFRYADATLLSSYH